MKKFVLYLCLISSFAYGKSVQDAFVDFYDNPLISSRHCGLNIQHFLKYLDEEGITYSKGRVVSVHEQVGSLNHFDARWGSRSYYENGNEYLRSNWYFHVFVIIDGVAYDFSQTGPKSMSYKDYLTKAYIPESKTENIFFLGKYTKKEAMKDYLNMEMNIYDAKVYKDIVGRKLYQGVFYELFNL